MRNTYIQCVYVLVCLYSSSMPFDIGLSVFSQNLLLSTITLIKPFGIGFCAVSFFLQVSALLSIGFLYLARKQTTEKQLAHEHGHPYSQ